MKSHYLMTAVAASTLLLAACGTAEAPPTDTTTVADETMPAPVDPTASANPTVGGAEMFATKTIVDNAIASPIHTTLVAAVKQAGLVETLSGAGPFTVFAPTNDAFAKVPKATLDGLMRPAQKEALAGVLTYHVVPGALKASDIAAQITAGGGKAMLKTVQGQNLTATMVGDKIVLTGENGSTATVTQGDVMQSNGVIHVIDGVVTPKM